MTVNNDFHDNTAIFDLFKGLELDADTFQKPFGAETQVNGNHVAEPVVNGTIVDAAETVSASG